MPGREIELKLRVRPEDLRLLSDAPALGADSGTTRTLESVYFDTPDLKLRRAGAVLRVRRDGTQYLQTLKSAANGSLLQRREESEAVINGARPDLALLRRRFPALRAKELRPVFTSRVQRTIREVRGIEVAFDKGEISTPEWAVEHVSEVELELKSGTPAAVFALALELAETAPVVIETRSKSDRGYALAGAGRGTGAVHAAPIELDPEISAGEAIETIFRQCLTHLTSNQPLVMATGDPGGLHQMRVALRRTRSALGLLREFLPQDERKLLAGEAKWLADLLGAARDHDVLLAETLAPVRAAFPDDPALARLAEAAEAERNAALERLRAAVESSRYAVFVLRLGAFIEQRSFASDEPAAELASRLLEKRAKRAKRLGKGFESLDTERRHDLRISLKKLRYAAEFFRSLYPAERAKKYVKRLTTLQGALGRINDLSTARRLLDDLAAGVPPKARLESAAAAGRVIGWHARALADAEPALVKEWKAFSEARPFWS